VLGVQMANIADDVVVEHLPQGFVRAPNPLMLVRKLQRGYYPAPSLPPKPMRRDKRRGSQRTHLKSLKNSSSVPAI
jgi:hypothetical protein